MLARSTLAVALVSALLAACSSSSNSPRAVDSPPARNNDGSAVTGVVAARFNPSAGVIPFPTNLLFSGTTDLTLVSVAEENGEFQLRREAVGNHLLVGGDNMDLALAYLAAEKFRVQGHELDPWQSTSLWHACRQAKESTRCVTPTR